VRAALHKLELETKLQSTLRKTVRDVELPQSSTPGQKPPHSTVSLRRGRTKRRLVVHFHTARSEYVEKWISRNEYSYYKPGNANVIHPFVSCFTPSAIGRLHTLP
jgi:hypothetical protein